MSGHLGSLPDEALAKMARDGSQAAFEALCDRTLPYVYNRLRALLPPEAVEDVTQEVFVAALRGIKRYRGHSCFRTWIAGIARHKVADYYRRQGRQPDTVPLDTETHNPAAREEWEERATVRIALRKLPIHYQEVLILRFTDGLPFSLIADTLGISLEATKSRYRRAVAAIAQEMETERS